MSRRAPESPSEGARVPLVREIRNRDGLAVTIPGPSVPQGSIRAFKNRVTGDPILTSTTKNLKQWRGKAALCIRQAMLEEGMTEPWDGPIRLWMEDCRLKPKGVKRPYPSVRPDLDKVIRACLDALTAAGVIRDDCQVVEIEAYKCYAPEPRMELRLYPIIDTWEVQK